VTAAQVNLEAVRRSSGGRIHLTPRVPPRGPVTTLCGKTLDGGTYAAVQEAADCVNCRRRSRDQSRISGAFFAQDAGAELLKLSLEQARLRQRTRSTETRPSPHPAPPPPVLRVVPEMTPEVVGELVTRDFKRAGEGVWRSPHGVVIRMRRRDGRWRFDELVYEGSIVATRTAEGVRIRAGDVEVAPTRGGHEIRVKKV
jgi:hypothetical protein